VNEQLAKEGYKPVTKQDIEVNYMSLLNIEKSKLEEMYKDEKQPILIRLIIKNMLGNKGFDVIDKMLDRAI
jgi:hypothetical protein